ncbi:fimbrillin family protein [Oscillospiraceae bacterium N12]|jgi:hypothetical protein|uniref:Fimbrillin family protein n=1 Tax=Jilunia laotingensis TaxID=2763675 RepID=A0A926F3M2_9BACT|nr:fimbrillin family protein [Jilunia laotingensis]MBC8593405.1 fimbrillin family protein [Jilunia laotingensis]
MRTKNLMMVMAVLALAGCSQNEVTDMNPDAHPVIGFDVYTGVQTRGAETDLGALKVSNAGFGFFAYKTAGEWSSVGSDATPDFLYNEHGTWTDGSPSGSWGYTNTRFWPTNDDKISFFSYAPYEASPTDGSNKGIKLSGKTDKGAPVLDFALTTSNDYKDMVDLVTDCRDDIKNQIATSNKANAGIVSFKFSHVLTKVADIKVKPDQSLGTDIKIYVKELKLLPGTNKLQNKAKYQFSDGKWGAASEGASYFTSELDLSGFLNKDTSVDWCGYTTPSVDVSSTTATSLFPSGQALYFIPVDNVTGTGVKGDLKLKIKYAIVTKVSDSTNVTSETEKEVELPQYTFKKGTAHTYTLTIKLNTIGITVDDSAINWDTATGEDLNVE